MSHASAGLPSRQHGRPDRGTSTSQSAGRLGYRFDPIPRVVNDLIRDGYLKSRDAHVLAYLLRYAPGITGSCWMSNNRLAELVKCDVATIKRALASLKKVGLIRRDYVGKVDPLDAKNHTEWRFYFLWMSPGWTPTLPVSKPSDPPAEPAPQSAQSPQEGGASALPPGGAQSPQEGGAQSHSNTESSSFGFLQTEAKRDDDDRAMLGIPTRACEKSEPTTGDESPPANPGSSPSSSSSSIDDQDSDFWVEPVGPPPPGPGWKDRPLPPAFSEPDRPSPPSPSPSPKPQTTAAQESSFNTPQEVAGIVQRMRKAFPGLDNIEARATEVLHDLPAQWVVWAIEQALAKKMGWKYACGTLRNWKNGDGTPEPPPKPKPAPMQNSNPVDHESRKPNDWTPEELEDLHKKAARGVIPGCNEATRRDAVRAASHLRFCGKATEAELEFLRAER